MPASRRDDVLWLTTAAAYLDLRAKYDELGTRLEEAKSALVGLTSRAKEKGSGLSITRLWKRGNIDYKRVTALIGPDLEQYRGEPREETRVIVS